MPDPADGPIAAIKCCASATRTHNISHKGIHLISEKSGRAGWAWARPSERASEGGEGGGLVGKIA
jgi:hypothetical protein